MNTFTRHMIVIAASCAALLAGSACSELERLVYENGYIPLSELDLIKLTTDKKSTSTVSLMGTTVPAGSLKKDIFGTPYLKAVTNPLRAPYVFDINLTAGPDELTKKIESALSVNLIKLKSWVNIGLSGKITSKLALHGILHGSLSMSDEQMIPFFIACEPWEGFGKQNTFVWITDVLAADIDISKEGGISADMSLDKYPVNITLANGAAYSLKGPGLVFGIRGRTIKADNMGTLKETVLPETGKSITTPFTTKNNAALTLIISRINTTTAKFAIAELTGTEVYMNINNEWKKESSYAAAAIAQLEPAQTTNKIEKSLDEGITRVVIIKRTLSTVSLVVSLAVTKNDGAYVVRGYAYNVMSTPLETEKTKNK